ncbi:hypothetical protein QWY29_20200, partial [Nocardioides sp. SOB72]
VAFPDLQEKAFENLSADIDDNFFAGLDFVLFNADFIRQAGFLGRHRMFGGHIVSHPFGGTGRITPGGRHQRQKDHDHEFCHFVR